MPAFNETLYAQWEKKTTLTFSNGTTLSLSNTAGATVYTTVTLPAGATIYYTYNHTPSGVASGAITLYSGATYGSPDSTDATSKQSYSTSGTYSYKTTVEDTILLMLGGGGAGSFCTGYDSNGNCTNYIYGYYTGSLTVTKITDANGNEFEFK